jgi:hypothetical protein
VDAHWQPVFFGRRIDRPVLPPTQGQLASH